MILLVVLLALAIIAVLVVLTTAIANRRGESKRELRRENVRLAMENERHNDFLDLLSDTLVQHRELDSELAVIVQDDLRKHRRDVRTNFSNKELS